MLDPCGRRDLTKISLPAPRAIWPNLTFNYDRTPLQRAGELLKPLGYVEGLEFCAKVPYMDFLSRVNHSEAEARANGSWHAPHPWLNIFVSARDIVDFDREVFRKILRRGVGGPMLVYPMLRSK